MKDQLLTTDQLQAAALAIGTLTVICPPAGAMALVTLGVHQGYIWATSQDEPASRTDEPR